MTKDETLKLALEALEVANSCVDGYYIPKGKTHLPEIELAITAIKEALAQTEQLMSDQINYGMSVTQGGKRIDPMSIYKEREQEPVAIVAEIHMSRYTIEWTNGDLPEGTKLYTTPLQRKPLTDDQITLIIADCASSHQHTDIHLARAIEAAHGIKGEV